MELRLSTSVRRLKTVVTYELRANITTVPCLASGVAKISKFDVMLYRIRAGKDPELFAATLRYKRCKENLCTAYIEKLDVSSISVNTGKDTGDVYDTYTIEAVMDDSVIAELTIPVTLDGATGMTGPMVFPAGIYDANTPYTCTDKATVMVLDGENYYVLALKGTVTGLDPSDDYAANGVEAHWQLMDKMEYAFFNVVMANFAKFASAVFYGDYMISQQGIDSEGNETWDYRKFGTKDFIPNLEFDFKTGAASFGHRNLVINKSGGINMRGSFITPYISIMLEPDIPLVLVFEGRLNAYIICNGSATEKFYFELPPASKTEPGSELNLFNYTPPGRLAPHPIARCSVGSGDVLLPANKNQFQMPATFEVKFKLVKTGYNGTDRAWYIVNHSDIPESNYSNYS